METRSPRSPIEMGSIQNRIPAPYNFSILGLLGEAWRGVKGFKSAVLIGIALFVLINVVILFIFAAFSMIIGTTEAMADRIAFFAYQITNFAITLPLFVGLFMLGVRRSVNLPVAGGQIFSYYKKMVGIFLLGISKMLILVFFLVLSAVLTSAAHAMIAANKDYAFPPILFFIASIFSFFTIYLALGYLFVYPLKVEKNLTIWRSLETSRKGVTQHWFKIFFSQLLLWIIIIISILPFGIGLIWSLPLGLSYYGLLYRKIFGVEEVR